LSNNTHDIVEVIRADKSDEQELKKQKLKTGLWGFLGEGDEKSLNIVFIVFCFSMVLTIALIILAYTTSTKNPVIDFASIFVFLTNTTALAFGFIFGRVSQGNNYKN